MKRKTNSRNWARGRTSLQAGSPALPPTDHPKKIANETGPKVRHKQDHGGSTHNGPHLWYTEEPVPVKERISSNDDYQIN